MTPPLAKPPRTALGAARSGLLTCSSAAPAIAAHALAGGGVSRTVLMGLLTLVIAWLATVLAETLRGVVGTVLVLGFAQVMMHVLLGGHGPHTRNLAIVAAHAGATVLTAVLLTRAESLLEAVAAGLCRWLHTVWRPPPVPVGPVPRVVGRAAGGTHFVDIQLRRVHGRRGPPAHS